MKEGFLKLHLHNTDLKAQCKNRIDLFETFCKVKK